MKKRFLSMLVLLVAVVTGAWAQDPTYIVAGNKAEIFGSVWYGSDEANKMTKGDDGKYTKTYNVEDAIEDIQLKVVKDGQDWFGDETGNNVTFSMKQAGSFTVTIDPNANPVYATVTGANVVFANTEYAINYATGMQNGTVTGPDTAKEDDEVTLTITPAAGYVLESISVTGVTTENAVEVTDGKFTMPAEDVNVIATFKLVTYAITLAEGTEDADKWTISPNPAEAGSPVTATYSGEKKVKSVKAVKKGDPTVKSAKDATAEDLGKVIGIDGKIYKNVDAAQAAGTTGVAMIVYVGSATGETSYTHGLALALKDARNGGNCIWRSPKVDAGHDKQTDSNFTTESGLQYNDNTHNSDTYRAFKEAMANNNTDTPTGCSAWFLPTGYQWNQMINACKNVLGTNNNQKDLSGGFSGVGGTNLKNNRYWSSTEYDADKAWRYDFGSGNWGVGNKNLNYVVRSAIAF